MGNHVLLQQEVGAGVITSAKLHAVDSDTAQSAATAGHGAPAASGPNTDAATAGTMPLSPSTTVFWSGGSPPSRADWVQT